MKKLFLILLTVAIAAVLGLGGCGDDDHEHFGPGLVGLNDTTISTAPLLIVTYTVPPSPVLVTANILSDLPSDGDIAFDTVLNSFIVTISPTEVLFGVDSANPHQPEYHCFLTFPLDGITGQPVVPGDAVIVSAFLQVFVDQVDFASTVPTFLDLIQYPFRGLSSADFDAPLFTPGSFRTLNFFSSDQGNFVTIDVTGLMEIAQAATLLDFQTRFSVQNAGIFSILRGPSVEASRSAQPGPRAMENIIDRTPTPAGPLSPEALKARQR
jgi:hypothetical protein